MSSPKPWQAFLGVDQVWRQVLNRPFSIGRPALFLDRDGVIVEEVGYLCRVEDIVLIVDAPELIAAANLKGVPVIIVTNQAGIARGYYGWDEFHQVQETLFGLLKVRGAVVDAVFASPYHPDGTGAYEGLDHVSRKPQPGMLFDAAALLKLDLGRSWIVGDKVSDLEAGRAAGLYGAFHVLTGHGLQHREACLALDGPGFSVRCGNSAGAALELLLALPAIYSE